MNALPDHLLAAWVVRSPTPVVVESGDGIMMMSVETAKYLSLNRTGARIWRLMQEPIAVQDLCERLTSDCGAEREEASADVATFVERMVDERIARLVDEPRS